MASTTTVGWLKAASGITFAFGLLCSLATIAALSGIIVFFFDLAFWPIDGGQSIAVPELKLALAVSGGILMGWAVLMWLVATRVYARDAKLGRSMILASIATWFVTDGMGSVAAGAPLNVLLNVPFLLMFALPVLWPERPAGGIEHGAQP